MWTISVVHFRQLTVGVDHVDRNTVSIANVKILVRITMDTFDQNLTCYGQKWPITHSRSWIRALIGTRTFKYLNLGLLSDTDPDTIKSRHHGSGIDPLSRLLYIINYPVRTWLTVSWASWIKLQFRDYGPVSGSGDIWAATWQKPTKWVCAQRRLRTAWASTQSDQSLRCALNG